MLYVATSKTQYTVGIGFECPFLLKDAINDRTPK